MAGYIPFGTIAPRWPHVAPPMPVVDRALVQASGTSALRGAKSSRRNASPDSATVARMRALRGEGQSLRAIGRALGWSHAAVLCHTRDVPPPPGGWSNGSRPSAYSVSFAQRLYRCGFTFREIGEDFGCSESWAHSLVNGVLRNQRGARTQTSRVVAAVAKVAGVDRRDLRRKPGEPKRHVPAIEKARCLTYWLLRRKGASYAEIGRSLGGFDHTAPRNGCLRVEAVIAAHGLTPHRHDGRAARQLFGLDWRGLRP